MSSGARHGLGVVIGLVATPVIAACLMYGTFRLGRFAQTLQIEGSDRWLAAAILIFAAILLGLLAGSRVSPVASLIPGFVYTVLGLLWMVAPRWAFEHTGERLPNELDYGYLTIGPLGVLLVLGLLLVVASVAPSRWKSSRATGAAPRFGGPPPAPMGPPPMHGAPAPMGAPQQHHPPQAPPAPGQSPPWQGGAPQYGQPPAQPSPANPPPLPSTPPAPPADDKPEPSRSGPDDDEPGEWTQMYGGNRPR